jgi:hypothetical protein
VWLLRLGYVSDFFIALNIVKKLWSTIKLA